MYLLEAPPGSFLGVRRDVGGIHVPDEIDAELPFFEVQLLHQPAPTNVRRGGACDALSTRGCIPSRRRMVSGDFTPVASMFQSATSTHLST